MSGLQLSFYTDHLLNVSINDYSSDVYTSTKVFDGIQRFIGFSMENISFDDNLEITIENGLYLGSEDIEIILGSTCGEDVQETWNDSITSELKTFSINKMFPNPFNPSTEINYTVNNNGNMRISVYNLLGQSVSILTSGYKEAGTYSLTWDASDVSSGMYFVKANAEGFSANKKLILMK